MTRNISNEAPILHISNEFSSMRVRDKMKKKEEEVIVYKKEDNI